MGTDATALTVPEREALDALVATVKRGLGAFVEVGNALRRIRDERLWRGRADSFETFCESEFTFGKRRANQIINAAEAADDVSVGKNSSQSGDSNRKTKDISSISQAEELSKAPKSERSRVWDKAVNAAPKDAKGSPKVTAAAVRRVVEESKPAPPKVEPWQDVAASAERIMGSLNTVANDMRESFGADSKGSEKKLTNPGATRYTWMGTIGRVLGVIDYLRQCKPVGSDAKGIITAEDAEKAKGLAGKGGK